MALETTKLANLIELGSEVWNEEINYITKVLEEAGNNINTAEQKLADLISTAKADLAIGKGAKLNELYQNAKAEIKNITVSEEEINYKMAAKNLEKLSQADMNMLQENMDIIKRMEKQ